MKSPKQKFWQKRNGTKWLLTACAYNLNGLASKNPALLEEEIEQIEMAKVSLFRLLEEWPENNVKVRETLEDAI